MIYTLNDITETRAWLVRDAQRLRKAFIEDAYEDQGVLRWRSNDRAVPPWSFREAFCTVSDTHLAAYDRETSEFLDEYRRAQANHVPDAEEMFEMRAAFGEGATVVNVLTGRRARL